VFQRELKFQREEEAAGTRCTEQGPLIARLLTEACQARNLTRAARSRRTSRDAASVPDGKPEADERDAKADDWTGVDPMNYTTGTTTRRAATAAGLECRPRSPAKGERPAALTRRRRPPR
jgi:hypothetical protein